MKILNEPVLVKFFNSKNLKGGIENEEKTKRRCLLSWLQFL